MFNDVSREFYGYRKVCAISNGNNMSDRERTPLLPGWVSEHRWPDICLVQNPGPPPQPPYPTVIFSGSKLFATGHIQSRWDALRFGNTENRAILDSACNCYPFNYRRFANKNKSGETERKMERKLMKKRFDCFISRAFHLNIALTFNFIQQSYRHMLHSVRILI